MSRLTPLKDEEMTPRQLELAQINRASRGTGATAILTPPTAGLSGPYEAMLRSPELAFRYRELASWAFAVTSMPRDLVEFAILVLAKHWHAQFPFWAYVILGRQAGLAEDVIQAIRDGAPIPFSDANQRLVCEFLTEYLSRDRVTEQTYTRLRDAFGESGVMDLAGLMGVYAMTAITANVFEVAIPGAEDDPAIEPA